jgi:endonuclease G
VSYDDLAGAARQRAKGTVHERARVRGVARVHPKQPWIADPDEGRQRRFGRRNGAESINGPSDFQPFLFLSEGARVGATVARVTTPSEGGSGFMISPHLFITNNHVIDSVTTARGTRIGFNYQLDAASQTTDEIEFGLAPDVCFITAKEDDLDFTIVALGNQISSTPAPVFGYCPLSERDDKHALGIPLNIIQHPQRRPKTIVVRNNLLTQRVGRVLQYETDTDAGSSGSPVFNDLWEVVAIHHWGEAFLETKDSEGRALPNNVNEGIRISAIIERLHQVRDSLPPRARQLVDEALDLGSMPAPRDDNEPILHFAHSGAEFAPITQGTASMTDEIRLAIPLEITLRVGDAGRTTASARSAAATVVASSTEIPELSPAATSKLLRNRSEGVVPDKHYANREGYDPGFLDGDRIAIPQPKDTKALAPLLAGGHELKYTHFSALLHHERRVALVTATNIDGEHYLKIVRATGKPAKAEATDTWSPDPRVDPTYYLGAEFYAKTSVYFDRGHLTRREDPNWGSTAEAVRANADTFHLTNCSPQNWFFNESTSMWQGVEQFVLEKGAIATKNKLCVFQGPVLDDNYATISGAQVPLEFWKVVAWIGAKGLQAAGFKVSQTDIVKLKRGTRPKTTPGKDYVTLYRVPVKVIANETGLDFGALTNKDNRNKLGEGELAVTELTPDIL